MKILGALFVVFACLGTAEAQLYGGGQYYNGGYNGGGGFNGGYGGLNNGTMMGEQADASSLINCQCAMLVKQGREQENPACANFGRLYEKAVIGAGSMSGGIVPGASSNHIGPI